MNIELTKEQSLKGDEFLKKLLSNGALERQKVYDFFNDRDEAIVVCRILEQKGIIILNSPTYNDPFTIVIPEDGISTFLKNGGLTKISIDKDEHLIKEKLEKQIRGLTIDNLRLNNWDIRFRWVIAVITFIIGFITKYFIDR
ncbi:hypothetical protein [Formosa sp. S-31]|uniref:hypothetical protein n=1 Tax=Formosa sp. S-31 TaxID=2790949 RepID=UPI003EB9FCB5